MKIIFTVFLSICWSSVFAQYFQFSQYNFTPQRINPAYVASSDYAMLSAVYRNQYTNNGFRINSTILNVSYPLISGSHGRWSGIGLSFMDDRSGKAGIFNTQEAALSYAVNLHVASFQTISFGAKVLYQKNRVDVSGLTTGLQFGDHGFDQSLPLGEDFGQLSNQFLTFSTGIHWQKTDKKEITIAYWDISFFDFNKPDNAFTEKASSLNATLVAGGGLRAYKKGNMSIYPELLYTRSASNNVVNAGVIFRCDTRAATNVAVPHVDFLAKYVVGRSAIFGFQYHTEKFGFGISTDLPFFFRNVSNISSIEVGIVLKSLVEKEAKAKLRKAARPIVSDQPNAAGKKLGATVGVKKPPTAANRAAADSAKAITRREMSDRLKQKQDSVVAKVNAGAVTHEPLILEKATLYFNFEFNSAELDGGSEEYLEDLAKALLDNPELKIKLEGHTDNVGSEKFNLRLSLERAKAVKTYMISKGVDASRIEAQGKGMAEPLNANETEQDKAKNRRVELEILYDH